MPQKLYGRVMYLLRSVGLAGGTGRAGVPSVTLWWERTVRSLELRPYGGESQKRVTRKRVHFHLYHVNVHDPAFSARLGAWSADAKLGPYNWTIIHDSACVCQTTEDVILTSVRDQFSHLGHMQDPEWHHSIRCLAYTEDVGDEAVPEEIAGISACDQSDRFGNEWSTRGGELLEKYPHGT
jgi:hypothetical protein